MEQKAESMGREGMTAPMKKEQHFILISKRKYYAKIYLHNFHMTIYFAN